MHYPIRIRLNKSYYNQGVSLQESAIPVGGQLPGISSILEIPGGSTCRNPSQTPWGQLAGTGGQSGMEWGVKGGRNS